MGLSLITRAEYKAYAGISSNTLDAQIDILIVKVSQLVKSLCRRSFVDYIDDPKLEYHEGGTSILSLEEYPVLAVSSVSYSSDFGKTYTDLTEYTDYAISKSLGVIKALTTTGFIEAINGYRVTYTAGFEELPEDLKLAILDLMTYYIKNDSAIHSSKAPGTNTVQIEYVTTTNLPSHIKRVLDQYSANFN